MKKTKYFLKEYNVFVILILLIIVCTLLSPNFFTPVNLANIGKQYAAITIISLGMLMVVMTGGIDLSVGSVIALGSVTIAICLSKYHMPMLFAVIVTILVGILTGGICGILVSKVKMPPFIVTMAMLTMAKGVAFIISNGSPIKTENLGALGKGSFGRIPYLVFIAVIFVIFFTFLINKTSYGRILKGIGSCEKAVRLAGIRVDYYVISAYMISGACAAVAGIISASRTGTGTPLYGDGLELDAIAACVIGGASLNGGKGSAPKTLVGVLVLALIGNIMNLMSIPSYPQDVIQGIIIIASILLQIATSSKSE